MFAFHAHADVGAFFVGVVGVVVGVFDGLVVVAEAQADRVDFVDDVRLLGRGGVALVVT